MRSVVRAAMGNFKEVAIWVTGVIIGFIVFINQQYLFGLGVMAFCGFMTKIALAEGVRSNAMLAAHAAKHLAEIQSKRKRDLPANADYNADDEGNV
jgi:hypothetical protein